MGVRRNSNRVENIASPHQVLKFRDGELLDRCDAFANLRRSHRFQLSEEEVCTAAGKMGHAIDEAKCLDSPDNTANLFLDFGIRGVFGRTSRLDAATRDLQNRPTKRVAEMPH